MRRSLAWAVLLVATVALVTACGAGGESREPTTTVQGELGETAEEAPVRLHEDETDGEGEEDPDEAGGEEEGPGKGKDKGKAHAKGGND
jgi:hypothetical protein